MASEAWSVIQVLLTAVVGLIGWLMRRSIGDMDRRQNAAEARIDKQDDRLHELEENTVTKEDWLREVGFSRKQLEEIRTGIAELKGRQEQAVDIAAAVAAALNYQRDKAGER